MEKMKAGRGNWGDADLQTVLCFYTVTRVKKSEGRNDEKISST